MNYIEGSEDAEVNKTLKPCSSIICVQLFNNNFPIGINGMNQQCDPSYQTLRDQSQSHALTFMFPFPRRFFKYTSRGTVCTVAGEHNRKDLNFIAFSVPLTPHGPRKDVSILFTHPQHKCDTGRGHCLPQKPQSWCKLTQSLTPPTELTQLHTT